MLMSSREPENPMTACTIPTEMQLALDAGSYRWSPEAGLDPAVVETVEPWIRQVAGQLSYPAAQAGLTVEDLVQEGRMGALLAARSFDPAYTKWLAFAKLRIRGAMLRALGRRDISIPDEQFQAFRRAGAIPAVGSLDAPAGDTGTTLVELLHVQETQFEDAIQARRCQALWAALERLEPREKAILVRHHGLAGEAEPLARIAADWGISGTGAQRIERIARLRLRTAITLLEGAC